VSKVKCLLVKVTSRKRQIEARASTEVAFVVISHKAPRTSCVPSYSASAGQYSARLDKLSTP
jgi:hypothetical protein